VFERFTKDARAVVTAAQVAAREAGADRIGTGHLLLGCAVTEGVAAAALAEVGVTEDRLRAALRENPATGGLDADALATIGVDLDAVVARADEVFGPGALLDPHRGRTRGSLRFSPASRKALQIALREARHGGDRGIDAGHLLVAFLRMPESTACEVLGRCDVTAAALRAAVRRRRDLAA
jgi:ATP-dependent Clp protease ATP-binding subunit ClpA